MRLRCYLFKYSVGSEVIRWFHDDGTDWQQQVFKLVVDEGRLVYTGDDQSSVSYMPSMPKLIEEGHVEEL